MAMATIIKITGGAMLALSRMACIVEITTYGMTAQTRLVGAHDDIADDRGEQHEDDDDDTSIQSYSP